MGIHFDGALVHNIINILDLGSDIIYGLYASGTCTGWAISLVVVTALGAIGLLFVMCGQCCRKTTRDRTKSGTQTDKNLKWTNDYCETGIYYCDILLCIYTYIILYCKHVNENIYII